MTRTKLSMEQIKYMSYFGKITKAKVRDCFVDLRDILTFVVEPGQIILAVGKSASNVRKLEEKLGRKIRIVEYNPDIKVFVKNLLHPNKFLKIEVENDIIEVTPADLKSRGYMIGKSAIMVKTNTEILKRFFPDILELKILTVPENSEISKSDDTTENNTIDENKNTNDAVSSVAADEISTEHNADKDSETKESSEKDKNTNLDVENNSDVNKDHEVSEDKETKDIENDTKDKADTINNE